MPVRATQRKVTPLTFSPPKSCTHTSPSWQLFLIFHLTIPRNLLEMQILRPHPKLLRICIVSAPLRNFLAHKSLRSLCYISSSLFLNLLGPVQSSLFVNIPKVFLRDPVLSLVSVSPHLYSAQVSKGDCHEEGWISQNQKAPAAFSWSSNVLTPQVMISSHLPRLKAKQRTAELMYWTTIGH